jgi:hypothetical protein
MSNRLSQRGVEMEYRFLRLFYVLFISLFFIIPIKAEDKPLFTVTNYVETERGEPGSAPEFLPEKMVPEDMSSSVCIYLSITLVSNSFATKWAKIKSTDFALGYQINGEQKIAPCLGIQTFYDKWILAENGAAEISVNLKFTFEKKFLFIIPSEVVKYSLLVKQPDGQFLPVKLP